MRVDVTVKRCRLLKEIFGTTEYTPEQVAELRWLDLVKIKNVGAQTVAEIRRWLGQFDLDLKEVPEFVDSNLARDVRILWAMVELELMGYTITPPERNT
jgi:hypothetical protein